MTFPKIKAPFDHWPPRFSRLLLISFFLLMAGLANWTSALKSGQNKNGTFKFSIVDEISNRPTPARVELLDQNGKAYVAEDAPSGLIPLAPGNTLPGGKLLLVLVGMQTIASKEAFNARVMLWENGKPTCRVILPSKYNASARIALSAWKVCNSI